jgi:hypothetical protein
MAGIAIQSPDAAIAQLAATIPQPANAKPKSEMTGGAVGTQDKRFALEDHQHDRLTSTTYATLAADGRATVTFTRTFMNKPGFSITEIDGANTQPLVCVVESFIQPGGAGTPYTGCVVKGYRSQALPAQPQMNVLAILTTVVGGINAMAASLTGFNVFGGSPSGASVSVVAIARSDVASN